MYYNEREGEREREVMISKGGLRGVRTGERFSVRDHLPEGDAFVVSLEDEGFRDALEFALDELRVALGMEGEGAMVGAVALELGGGEVEDLGGVAGLHAAQGHEEAAHVSLRLGLLRLQRWLRHLPRLRLLSRPHPHRVRHTRNDQRVRTPRQLRRVRGPPVR